MDDRSGGEMGCCVSTDGLRKSGWTRPRKVKEGRPDPTHLFRVDLEKHVVPLPDAMLVRPAVLPPPLKVLAIDQAAVDVVVRERDGAELLKVEIERVSVDLPKDE
jgi:hypothetical protein